MNVDNQEVKAEGSHTISGLEMVYWIKCTNCNVSFEIIHSAYAKMKPFLEINEKLRNEDMTTDKYLELRKKHLLKLGKRES